MSTRELVERHGIAAVERRVGVERSTISRWCRADEFPKPMYLGTRRFWTEEQLAAWEAEQVARQPEAERRAQELMKAAQEARSATEVQP